MLISISDKMNKQRGLSYIHLILILGILLTILIFFITKNSNIGYDTVNRILKLVNQAPAYPEIIWKTKKPNYVVSMKSDDKNIYLIGGNDLYAIDEKTGQEIWKWEHSINDQVIQEITLDDALIYVKGFKTIFLLKKQDGSEVGKIGFKATESAPQITNNQVLFSAQDNDDNFYLYSYNKDGIQNWKVNINDLSFGPRITAANNKLYFYARDHNLYALDELSGKTVWKTKVDIEEEPFSEPVYTENLVLFITNKNNLYALDANTGQVLWKTPAGLSFSTTILDKGLIGLNSPGLGPTNNFISFDIYSRQEKWKIPVPYGADVLVNNGTAYIGTGNGYILAVDIGTGKIKWKSEGGFNGSPKLVINNSLYVLRTYPVSWGDIEYKLSILDTTTGKNKWTWNEVVQRNEILKIDNTVYLYTKDYLYAIH